MTAIREVTEVPELGAQARSSPGVIALAGLTAAYFLAGKIGLSFALVHASASAVWPPTGIALAAFMLLGARAWPAIFAGAFLVNWTTSGAVASSIGIAVGNTLEGFVGAWLVMRYAHGAACFERARDVFRFAALAGLAATTISATIGVGSLTLAGQAPAAAFGDIWLTWWLGDAAGALVVAPPIVMWMRRHEIDWPPAKLAEAVATLVAVLAVGVLCFATVGGQRYSLAFLTFPPLAWLALRFGSREVATAVAVLAAIAAFTTERGMGPFVSLTRHESLLVLQAFMATMALTMLPLAALVGENARARAALERASREERRARAEAEAATRARDDFLATLSHELRNPLQAISSSILLIERGGVQGEPSQRALVILRRQTEQLTHLVNDLLDVARAVAGKIVLTREPLDLEPALRQWVEQLQQAGRFEGLAVDVRTEAVRVHADRRRLEQMVTNLLVNAAKFTPRGGEIRVSAAREHGEAVIRIEDTGVGIEPDLLPRIFDPFVQGQPGSGTAGESGLGLGLALVRRLAELHGGRVHAASEGIGRGSRFVLMLPVERET